MKKLTFLIPVLLIVLFSCNKDDDAPVIVEQNTELNDEVNNLQDSISVIIQKHDALLDSVSNLINIMNEEEVIEYADIKALKMEQISSLFESIARQPEAADILISSTEGLYKNYSELLPLSDKAIYERGKARGIAFSGLFEAIARQPEAFAKLDSTATQFLGVYSSADISDDLLEYTRVYCTVAINDAIARQPEADSVINIATKKYLNFEFDQE